MRNRILAALALAGALLFLAGGARAQTQTNVTATVVDPLGIPYANGTYSIQLIPTGTNPSVNGQGIGGAFNGSTDASGRFNVALWPNASIVPGGTTWQFVVCTNSGGVPPPLGTGNQCTTPTAVTIAGVSQDLSTTLSAVAPRLTTIGTGGVGPIILCTTFGGVLWENGTPNIATCSGNLTFINGTGLLNITSPTGSAELDLIPHAGGAFRTRLIGNNDGSFNLLPPGAMTLGSSGTGAQIILNTTGVQVAGQNTTETSVTFNGASTGAATVGVAAAAGTPNRINWPTTTGLAGQVLQTDGGSPQQTSWVSAGGAFQTNTVVLTSPQILNLATTPIAIVPAPGVGKLIVPFFIMLQYKFNTTAYSNVTGNLAIEYTPGNVGLGPNSEPGTGWADQTVDTYQNIPNSGPFTFHPTAAQADNKALSIFNQGADWTLGDGTIAVTTYYSVLATF